jgi:cleavage stimulation factor subunit 2
VQEILGRVGHVISYRAVIDKETGKPRGYAFAEYSDADSAASAVRNLNNHQLKDRVLRIDYANDKSVKEDGNTGGGYATIPTGQSLNVDSRTTGNAGVTMGTAPALPPLPLGRDLDGSLTAEDAISRTLSAIPSQQLLGILKQMQELVATDPARAQALLDQAPQLSYAIFQALLQLQLIDTAALGTIIQQTASLPKPPPAQQPYTNPPQPLPGQPYGQTYGQPGFPPPFPPQQNYTQNNTAVVQPQYAPQAPAAAPPIPNVQEALVQQLLSMPQSQIDTLPPLERDQIIALRQQYAHFAQR